MTRMHADSVSGSREEMLTAIFLASSIGGVTRAFFTASAAGMVESLAAALPLLEVALTWKIWRRSHAIFAITM